MGMEPGPVTVRERALWPGSFTMNEHVFPDAREVRLEDLRAEPVVVTVAINDEHVHFSVFMALNISLKIQLINQIDNSLLIDNID